LEVIAIEILCLFAGDFVAQVAGWKGLRYGRNAGWRRPAF
jgi:hypothetical protein